MIHIFMFMFVIRSNTFIVDRHNHVWLVVEITNGIASSVSYPGVGLLVDDDIACFIGVVLQVPRDSANPVEKELMTQIDHIK
jgi:hypothetical protein